MFGRVRRRLTYANVVSSFALFIALTTGTVYAANEWTGENIVDGSLTAVDLKIGTIGTARVQDNSLQAVDLAADSVTASELADNAVDSAAIQNGSITASDLGTASVGTSEIANGSVASVDIADGSLTGTDIANGSITAAEFKGAAVTGAISYSANLVPNGRCEDFLVSVGGANVGDVVVLSINGDLPQGVMIYGTRVPTAGHATIKICNLSGGAMPAIVNLPVSVFTIDV